MCGKRLLSSLLVCLLLSPCLFAVDVPEALLQIREARTHLSALALSLSQRESDLTARESRSTQERESLIAERAELEKEKADLAQNVIALNEREVAYLAMERNLAELTLAFKKQSTRLKVTEAAVVVLAITTALGILWAAVK